MKIETLVIAVFISAASAVVIGSCLLLGLIDLVENVFDAEGHGIGASAWKKILRRLQKEDESTCGN